MPVEYVRCICCGGPIFGDSVLLLDADTYDFVGIWCRRANCGVDESRELMYAAHHTHEGGDGA
jgi:hypothetical protein